MELRTLDDVIHASHQALAAIIRGDVEPFMALYSDVDDITIGNPFGPFAVGHEATRAAGVRAAGNYADGEITAFDRINNHEPPSWPTSSRSSSSRCGSEGLRSSGRSPCE